MTGVETNLSANDMVCILKDMQTVTIVYKLSVTNLEFTLGLTENIDSKGNKVKEFFLPMSLRVEDSSVERSNDGNIVDFIFIRDASKTKYDSIIVLGSMVSRFRGKSTDWYRTYSDLDYATGMANFKAWRKRVFQFA